MCAAKVVRILDLYYLPYACIYNYQLRVTSTRTKVPHLVHLENDKVNRSSILPRGL
jgi:hypothetical protein